MEILLGHLLFSFFALSQVHGALASSPGDDLGEIIINRRNFPDGFVFGAASSAYQVEGAWNVDGKGPNIWDNYTHTYPDRIPDNANGDVAVDSYHRYKEDVKLLNYMGMDAYRFSISWARVLPKGKVSGGVNKKGIAYYNKLIDALLKNGTEPYVTIFHFDVPQALEDEYGGFLSHQIVKDYYDFANLCFERFGDQVKHWITINEPYTFSASGYGFGDAFAPQRCSPWVNPNCTGGNSGTEPYIVAHNLLLAHAYAVDLYKTKYQARQKGIIGITLNSNWLVPLTNSSDDRKAAFRGLDFLIGWFLEPLVFGQYPVSMIKIVGPRLPEFLPEEAKLVKGSFDFIGLNYYTSRYAAKVNSSVNLNASFFSDQRATYPFERDGKPIGTKAASDWLYIYPQGIFDLLSYIKKTYDNPIIYITENGVDDKNTPLQSVSDHLMDLFRIGFHIEHLSYVLKAIDAGVQVKGYFGWALMDNFEFTGGYVVRFGLNYADFKTMRRLPKESARWFQWFLQK